MSYWGSGAADCDLAFNAVAAVASHIKSRLQSDHAKVSEKQFPEQSIVALVVCLRVLAERFPQQVDLYFGRRDLERARADFDEWFASARIPKKHRDGLRAEADREFEAFEQLLAR